MSGGWEIQTWLNHPSTVSTKLACICPSRSMWSNGQSHRCWWAKHHIPICYHHRFNANVVEISRSAVRIVPNVLRINIISCTHTCRLHVKYCSVLFYIKNVYACYVHCHLIHRWIIGGLLFASFLLILRKKFITRTIWQTFLYMHWNMLIKLINHIGSFTKAW